MSEKVVALHEGTTITSNGEPDPEVIELLEGALERAKSGAARGVAVFETNQADWFRNESAGNITTMRTMGMLALAIVELGIKYLKHEESEG